MQIPTLNISVGIYNLRLAYIELLKPKPMELKKPEIIEDHTLFPNECVSLVS
jgi:hypothetical protein